LPLTFSLLLSIFLGGGAGALLRFLLSRSVNALSSRIWLGTLTVNLLGCLIFFILIKWNPVWPKNMEFAVKAGVLGSLTTFSTFSVELVSLLKEGRWQEAVVVILLNIVFGIIIGIGILR
jgi:fluoride exporter